jgi:hypothetical protein
MIFSIATHGFYELEKTELKDVIYDFDRNKEKFEQIYPEKFVKIVFTLIESTYSAEDLDKIRLEIGTLPSSNHI